jgi:hypothetical protein
MSRFKTLTLFGISVLFGLGGGAFMLINQIAAATGIPGN